MQSSRLSFKLFIVSPAEFHVEELVPVFHSWIQTHAIKDHLLVDVASYAHVHNGPGVVLVAHEANYSLDQRGGRWGLTYQRKQPIPGTLTERLRITHQAVRNAAALLAERVRFRTDEIEFRICDRLHAPNNPDTFAAVKPDLAKVFPGAELAHRASEAELFEVTIKPK